MEEHEIKNRKPFACSGDNGEEIPPEALKASGTTLPEAHSTAEQMARLSLTVRHYRRDSMCRVPFCATVEAEALGGKVTLGDERHGPRAAGYALGSIEDLYGLREMELRKGRISEVLKAVDILNGMGELTALCVEGPFTVLSSLMESALFYRILRKERKAAEDFLQVIEDSLVKYILEGVHRGVRIISYADPAGSMDIVGPRVFVEHSGRLTCNILRRVQSQAQGILLHVCGKASASLEASGLCTLGPIVPGSWDSGEALTYGEALERLLEAEKGVLLIGNGCIKKSHMQMNTPELWQIRPV